MYKEIYKPQHHRAKTNGMVDEHLLIAEKRIGRELKKYEVVHHLDENKNNNDINNIVVFINNSNHIRFHKNGIMVETLEKFIYSSPKQFQDFCSCCGIKLNKSTISNMCKKCLYVSFRVVERPNRDELKKSIRIFTFVELGIKYTVSDNTIRKWCKYYNLPYRKSDINNYNNEEWDKL